MEKVFSYGSALVLVIFIGWYFYSQGQQDEKFKQQIEKIEHVRKSLEDSVKVLKMNTAVRDEKLRAVIMRDMEIMDTLNFTLKRLNANSKAIETKIEHNKKTIDELWNNN